MWTRLGGGELHLRQEMFLFPSSTENQRKPKVSPTLGVYSTAIVVASLPWCPLTACLLPVPSTLVSYH